MNKAEEAQAMIEAIHAELQAELDEAIADREAANDRVKAARAKFETAPRLHVKRNTKKSAVTVAGMTKVLAALGDSLKADEGDGEVAIMPELTLTSGRGA